MKTFLHLLFILYYYMLLCTAYTYDEEESLKSECISKLISKIKREQHITIVTPDADLKNFIKVAVIRSSPYSPIQWYMNNNLYIVYYEHVKVGPTAWEIRSQLKSKSEVYLCDIER